MSKPSEEDLCAFLGLSRSSRVYIDEVVKAQARARLMNLHPLSKPALEMLDHWISGLVEAEVAKRRLERERVLAAWKKYESGINDLGDLLGDLNEIYGIED